MSRSTRRSLHQFIVWCTVFMITFQPTMAGNCCRPKPLHHVLGKVRRIAGHVAHPLRRLRSRAMCSPSYSYSSCSSCMPVSTPSCGYSSCGTTSSYSYSVPSYSYSAPVVTSSYDSSSYVVESAPVEYMTESYVSEGVVSEGYVESYDAGYEVVSQPSGCCGYESAPVESSYADSYIVDSSDCGCGESVISQESVYADDSYTVEDGGYIVEESSDGGYIVEEGTSETSEADDFVPTEGVSQPTPYDGSATRNMPEATEGSGTRVEGSGTRNLPAPTPAEEPAVDPEPAAVQPPVDPAPAEEAPAEEDSADDFDDFGGDFDDSMDSTDEAEAMPEESASDDDMFGGSDLDDFGDSEPAASDDLGDDLFDEAPAEEGADTDLFDEAPADSGDDSEGDDLDVDDLFGQNEKIELEPITMRSWTDNTGRYKTVGKLDTVAVDHIRILKENGRFSTVPMHRLSNLDKQYVQRMAKRLGKSDFKIAAN